MARFHNPTGSVLNSEEFGLIPPGEFEVHGYDPEVHGVIPGCTWLDAPLPEDPPADDGEVTPPAAPKASGKRKGADDKEATP